MIMKLGIVVGSWINTVLRFHSLAACFTDTGGNHWRRCGAVAFWQKTAFSPGDSGLAEIPPVLVGARTLPEKFSVYMG